MIRFLLVFLLNQAGCTVPDFDQEPYDLPSSGFQYYTGDSDDAGDLWLGFTEYTHGASGKTCMLLPVFHIGEAAFFVEVQEEMDRADVVLTEGVGGEPDLSPGFMLLNYVFASSIRYASFGGLTHQTEVFRWQPTHQNADMEFEEFQDEGPWYTPALQSLFLPFITLVMEPIIWESWLEEKFQALIGRGDSFAAAWRHWLTEDANDSNSDNFLLPGLIDARNERLLERLDEVTEQEDVRRIAIPWGADHFEPLRGDLRQRGWRPTGHRWVRAIGVHALLDGDVDRADESFDFMIPWAMHLRGRDSAWSVSLLLNSIVAESRPTSDYRFELMWELLLSLRSHEPAEEFHLQVLPSLLGRPLLFRYESDADDWHLKFLWFFEI